MKSNGKNSNTFTAAATSLTESVNSYVSINVSY